MWYYITAMDDLRITSDKPAFQAAEPKRVRAVKGKPGVQNRLGDVDMRTREARAFKRYFKALVAEFGEHEAERCRELAALRALIDRTLSDALSSGIWSSLRARDQLGPLQNNARRLEEALRAAKASAAPPPDDGPLSIAAIAARHARKESA